MEKEIAIVKGQDLPISTKHAKAICKFIRRKKPEEAIALLKKVREKKLAIPFAKGIPHKKGIGGGRYPVKACDYFIKILNNIIANANVKGLDGSNLIILAKADKASRPTRAGRHRVRAKRTHLKIIANKEEK